MLSATPCDRALVVNSMQALQVISDQYSGKGTLGVLVVSHLTVDSHEHTCSCVM